MRHLLPVRSSSASAALAVVLAFILFAPAAGPAAGAEQKVLVDNERVMVVEFVFRAGFRGGGARGAGGRARVIDGGVRGRDEGRGKQVVRRGEVERAPRGVVHDSVNEIEKPARGLVVLLEGR